MKIAIICSQSNKELKSSLILRRFFSTNEIEVDSLLIIKKSFNKFNKDFIQEKFLGYIDHLFCSFSHFLLGIILSSFNFNYDFNSRKFFRIDGVIKNYSKNINNLTYVQNLNSDEVKDILIERNVDILILAGVGIVKNKIISIPGLTILNVHSSVLPGYRGTESEVFALADAQYDLIGNTVHIVNDKIDAGEILSITKFPYDKLKFGVAYTRYLNKVLSANNLFDTVKNFKSIHPKNNDMSKSVYKSRPTREVISKAKKNSYKCV
tara:strand:+ start:822 stop:1616 length:795 start_codon:yes stop_codon:yes gene_type:complete